MEEFYCQNCGKSPEQQKEDESSVNIINSYGLEVHFCTLCGDSIWKQIST